MSFHRFSREARALVAFTIATSCLLAACSGAHADTSSAATAATTAKSDSATAVAPKADSSSAQQQSQPAQGALAALMKDDANPPAIRALYVNRFKAQSSKNMRHYIGLADSTEINALVIDMKDEFGLNFNSANPAFAANGGATGKIRDVKALVDTLRAHNILPIARLVVFKDSVTARVHPDWTIRKQDGSIWRDHKGLAWVNPYHRELWDYNIGIAEELVKLGFGEVQFDYIRFPEPYKSLPPQVFSESKGQSKPDAIAEFLKTANARIGKLGVRTTADIFGLVTTVEGPLEVAQHWERLAPVTDVLLPMVYPSHYPSGSFNIPHPNAEPYKIVNLAISRARARNEKLGVTGERIRPWLQAFTLGKPPYGAEEIRQQKQAVYDAGYDGWVLWSPGSKYEPFEPALERGELVSHRKSPK